MAYRIAELYLADVMEKPAARASERVPAEILGRSGRYQVDAPPAVLLNSGDFMTSPVTVSA